MKKINTHLIIFISSTILLLYSIYYLINTLNFINNLIYINATVVELESNTNIATIEYKINDTTYQNKKVVDEKIGLKIPRK